jgi:hypothetical protein
MQFQPAAAVSSTKLICLGWLPAVAEWTCKNLPVAGVQTLNLFNGMSLPGCLAG